MQANNAKERFPAGEEAARLHDAVQRSANSQFKHLVALLLMFSCRKRELLDAKWEYFDLGLRN